MPAATHYLPADSELRKNADTELAARRTKYALAAQYYNGQHRAALRVRSGQPDDNVTINLWKKTKDREVTFLFGRMVGFETDDNAEDSDTETWLRAAWAENGNNKLLQRLARFGALSGHVFARVMPASGVQQYPRIVALHPANVLVYWKADDFEHRLWYEIRWSAGATEYRQDIVDHYGRWEINEFERPTSSADKNAPWRQTDSVEWPWPLGPVVDWAHIEALDQLYGSNEDSLLQMNDHVNRVASAINRILRIHGFPRTVGTGFEGEKLIETGIDNFWTIEAADAKVYNLEMQSDLASSMAYLEFLKTSYLAQGRVTVLSGNATDMQRTTNLGVRTLFMDQLAKTDELWAQYEPGIVGLSQRLLMLGNRDYTVQVRITRTDPLPSDPVETINVQEKELQYGLASKQTIARERGRNWTQEQLRMEDENAANDTAVLRQLRGIT